MQLPRCKPTFIDDDHHDEGNEEEVWKKMIPNIYSWREGVVSIDDAKELCVCSTKNQNLGVRKMCDTPPR